MLDVQDSAQRLQETVNDHFDYIQAGHDFTRAFAIQFELAYTDYRTIELALQLGGTSETHLLATLRTAYQSAYRFEAPFAMGGLAEFDKQCRGLMVDYEIAVNQINDALKQVLKDTNAAA